MKSHSSPDMSHEKEWDLKVRQPICYEPDESLMSWFASFMAFLDSDLESTCGSNVWMALPRLILVVFVHVDVAPAAVLVVISHIKAANPPGIFRFLLTCAAATNWPKFLNALASFSRSVRFVVLVRPSSLVARCELCSRTLPGLVLAIAFDEL